MWKKLWKLNIQSKVWVFMWRLARNIPPTRDRLRSKGVEVGDGCCFCDRGTEDTPLLYNLCGYMQARRHGGLLELRWTVYGGWKILMMAGITSKSFLGVKLHPTGAVSDGG